MTFDLIMLGNFYVKILKSWIYFLMCWLLDDKIADEEDKPKATENEKKEEKSESKPDTAEEKSKPEEKAKEETTKEEKEDKDDGKKEDNKDQEDTNGDTDQDKVWFNFLYYLFLPRQNKSYNWCKIDLWNSSILLMK